MQVFQRYVLTLIAFLLLFASAFADTHRWIGAADAVRQLDTITIAGTWATNDDWAGEINSKTVTVDIGTYSDTADVAAKIAAAINATSRTAGLVGDEERNAGGQEIPEFTEVVAEADGSTVEVESRVPGVPFTLTSTVTTGTGTAVLANTTAATGPRFWDNVDNWINDAGANALPVAGDKMLFDAGSVDCSFNIQHSVDGLDLERKLGYAGDIGLPRMNPAGYAEYRDRFMYLETDATTEPFHELYAGQVGTAVGVTYLDLGNTNASAGAITFNIYTSGPDTPDGKPIQIVGALVDLQFEIFGGGVSVGAHPQEDQSNIDRFRVSYSSETNAREPDVELGSRCVFTNVANFGGDLVVNGGRVYVGCNVNGNTLTTKVFNGQLVADAVATFNDVDVYGGVFDSASTTMVDLSIYDGGVVDFSRVVDATSAIAADVQLYSGFTYKDPQGITITNTFDFNGCTMADGEFIMRDGYSAALTGL